MKHTTIERFRKWCNNSAPTDLFTANGVAYTREQFGELFLGETPKTINNTAEETHADLGTTLNLFDIEEHGDGTS